MPSTPYDADLELALRAVRAAGEAVMGAFRSGAEVRYKGPDQPVTDADLAADRLLREALQGERPEYGWLSEETADSPERLSRERVWVVDPIDGTRSYVDGRAEFSLVVGLAVRGRAVLGVVYNPATGELYHAAEGGGAFLGGEPIRAGGDSGRRVLLASRSEIRRGELAAFGDWSLHPLGSTAYKMAKVADGTGDVFLSRGPKSEWDVCGAEVVVREAGGRVADSLGGELRYNRPDPRVRGVIAARPGVYEEVRARQGLG